jgi:hypothetical protein
MAVTELTLPMSSAIASLEALQEDCNNDERTSRLKLQSLELGENDNGEKATIAEYKKKDKVGLGKLRFEEFTEENEDAEFKGDVFIKTQPVKVLVFRDV